MKSPIRLSSVARIAAVVAMLLTATPAVYAEPKTPKPTSRAKGGKIELENQKIGAAQAEAAEKARLGAAKTNVQKTGIANGDGGRKKNAGGVSDGGRPSHASPTSDGGRTTSATKKAAQPKPTPMPTPRPKIEGVDGESTDDKHGS
jgi:hypothetical protein